MYTIGYNTTTLDVRVNTWHTTHLYGCTTHDSIVNVMVGLGRVDIQRLCIDTRVLNVMIQLLYTCTHVYCFNSIHIFQHNSNLPLLQLTPAVCLLLQELVWNGTNVVLHWVRLLSVPSQETWTIEPRSLAM